MSARNVCDCGRTKRITEKTCAECRELPKRDLPPGAHEFASDTSQPHRRGRCTQCGLSRAEGNHTKDGAS